jgi:hypothetical protein
MSATYRRLLVFPFALLAAFVLFIPIAIAATAEAPPAQAQGWQFADVMSLVALLVAGAGMLIDAVRAILHFTAPRTKTTIDDTWAARLDAVHERITVVEQRLPPVPGKGPTITTIALVLLVALLAGCGSTGRELGHDTGVALVDCTSASSAAIGGVLASMRSDVAAGGCSSKSDAGARSTDWRCVRGKAVSAGLAIGGCAFLELVSAQSDTPARALVAANDGGRAAFEDYRAAIAGGARFRTAAGDR